MNTLKKTASVKSESVPTSTKSKTKKNIFVKLQKLLIILARRWNKKSILVRFIRLIIIVCSRFHRNKLPLRTSAMTFTMLLSLVPMLATSTALIKGLGGDNQLKNVAYSYIDTLENNPGFHIPRFGIEEGTKEESDTNLTGTAPLSSWLRMAIKQLFLYVDKTNFTTLGIFGIAGILITVMLMLSHMETAMNTIWSVDAGRSLVRKLSDYMTLLVLFPLSLNVAFAVTALLKHPEIASKLDVIIPFEWLQTIVFQAVPMLFVTLALFSMYIFFPNTKVKGIPAVCGAVFAASLWFIMQDFYLDLQIGVAQYNAIYGTFASAPLFLIWIYLSWLLILLGAQLAWALQHINSVSIEYHDSSPVLQLAAAFDITAAVYENFNNNTAITRQELITSLKYDRRLSEAIVEKFIENDFLHLAQEDNRLLPLQSSEHLNKEKITHFILGGSTPNTTGGKESSIAVEAACEKMAEAEKPEKEKEIND